MDKSDKDLVSVIEAADRPIAPKIQMLELEIDVVVLRNFSPYAEEEAGGLVALVRCRSAYCQVSIVPSVETAHVRHVRCIGKNEVSKLKIKEVHVVVSRCAQLPFFVAYGNPQLDSPSNLLGYTKADFEYVSVRSRRGPAFRTPPKVKVVIVIALLDSRRRITREQRENTNNKDRAFHDSFLS